MIKPSLKKGDKLYRWVSFGGIFEYEVIGARDNREGFSYELICNTCNHGYKCEVLVAFDDQSRLKYVCMLNEDDEEPQNHWHVDGERAQFFHSSEKDALRNCCDVQVRRLEKDIKEREAIVTRQKERLALYKAFRGNYEEFKKAFCL